MDPPFYESDTTVVIISVVVRLYMSESNNPVVVKFELPQVVNDALKPLATSIGDTLASIWNGVFGDVTLWAEKKRIEREANLKAYQKETEKKLSLIEEKNIQEIKMSIVGPALESSRFYFEEEQYREMFSNLISAAADKSFNKDIHTSFTEVIKQLDPNDAQLLTRIISYEAIMPIVQILRNIPERRGFMVLARNLLPNQTADQYSCDLLSLDNLVRLNLIKIQEDQYSLVMNAYKWVDDHPIRIDKVGDDIEIIKGTVIPTEYGTRFIKVCLR